MILRERFKRWWQARQHSRRWGPAIQLHHLRVQMHQDNRWLASNKVASALTDRYLSMLADDWEKRVVVRIEDFRRLLEQLQSAPPCPYCSSDNSAVRETFFDQTCFGCVARMSGQEQQ